MPILTYLALKVSLMQFSFINRKQRSQRRKKKIPWYNRSYFKSKDSESTNHSNRVQTCLVASFCISLHFNSNCQLHVVLNNLSLMRTQIIFIFLSGFGFYKNFSELFCSFLNETKITCNNSSSVKLLGSSETFGIDRCSKL